MSGANLTEFLDREVYPALFERLDQAFPEYGFARKGKHWVATTDATRKLPASPRPDRVFCYDNKPWGLVVQGADFVRFVDLVNGNRKPQGAEFPAAVRKLAQLAGVHFPDDTASPEEVARAAERHARRGILETVIAKCHEALLGPKGVKARTYLAKRGYDEAAIEDLRLGLYLSTKAMRQVLADEGHDEAAVEAAAVLWQDIEGRVIYPWNDAAGHPQTLYADWPARPAPEGVAKLIALPGEGTKASPLHFDRARRAGHRDLVLVEGVADASVLQARGETRAIACVGRQLSGAQLDTLDRFKTNSVIICLDPDGAGVEGTLACIRQLYSKGITAFVAPLLPDGLDPDEFVLTYGIEAWRAHIAKAEHAFRYKARSIVTKHKGDGWTDRSKATCLDEAVEFDQAVQDPERQTDLSEFFWPEICAGTGADMDAVLGRVMHVRERAEAERERKAYHELVRKAEAHLNAGNVQDAKTMLRDETDRLRAAERRSNAEPIRHVADELAQHDEHLARLRGREFVGLPQKTLPELDDMTLGLRGLMLLAAAPNVGKTTLGVQFGLDVVAQNEDAAFLFLSLEMTRWEMLTRLRCNLAGLDWRTMVFGSRNGQFSQNEYEDLQRATETLRRIGPRIRILDDRNFPAPTLEKVIDQLRDLKAATGATRTFVLVDYLQVWPIPDHIARVHRSDNDSDKWRIGQMKDLRDECAGDPVMVISEAKKPQGTGKKWGGEMSDVMGSARGTYTPDIVILQQALPPEQLADGNEEGQKLFDAYAASGYAKQRISIVKGRDGVRRGDIDLRFDFRQSRFAEWRDD